MADLIEDGIEFLPGSGAVITRGATATKTAPIGKAIQVMTDGARGRSAGKIMGWGANNDTPNHRERLVAENNIVPSLLAVRRDITLGQGMFAYREKMVNGAREIEEVAMPTPAKIFFEQLEESGYWLDVAGDFFHHAMTGTEFIMTKGNTVSKIIAKRMRHLRAEEMNEQGEVKAWYWSGEWGNRGDEAKSRRVAHRLPVYDPERKRQPGSFVYIAGDPLFCLDEYYYTPSWWGSEEWIRLANCIPEFHQANLENGYSIRWHIQLPKGYFADKRMDNGSTEDMKKAKDAQRQAKAAFLEKLDQLLKGAAKAGKSLITTYEINTHLGQEFSGIKITPLSVDMKDEALLKLFEKSNQAVISAQGVHPTLANIETAGKLSSGTEIRNAFLMYLLIKTPLPRKIFLKPINVVKKLNGWPEDIHYGFRDMVLTPLNEDKSGKEEKTEATE